MDLPQVDSCCFGILPLKTGAMVAGLVTFLVELGTHGYDTYYGYGNESWIRTIFGILVICGIVASILLVYGAYTDNKPLVRFYVVVFVLLIIFTIAMLVLVLLRSRGGDYTTLIINTIIYILVIGYCVVVANSYYKTLG